MRDPTESNCLVSRRACGHVGRSSRLASLVARTALLLLVPLGCGTPSDPAGPETTDSTGLVPTGLDSAAVPLDAAIGWPDLGPITGKLATLTGTGIAGALDGPRGQALFDNPVNLAVGPDETIYVCDFNNNRVRRVAPDGTVSTLVQQANFYRPFGIAFTPNGSLYVQTVGNDTGGTGHTHGTIWKVDMVAGSASVVVRNIGRPRGLAALTDSTLVVVDNMAHVVQLLDLQAKSLTILAGATNESGYRNGQGQMARFHTPYGVVVRQDGTILVTDQYNQRLRAITPGGEVTTWAGDGMAISKDGAGLAASFNVPQGIAIDAHDTVYVTDLPGCVVRKIDASGNVTTIAGNGTPGFKDGEPLLGELFGLEGIAVSRDGQYVFCADGNRGESGPYHRIRRLTL